MMWIETSHPKKRLVLKSIVLIVTIPLVAVTLVLLLTEPGFFGKGAVGTEDTDSKSDKTTHALPSADPVAVKFANMTMQERIGQMIMISLPGKTLTAGSASLISECKIGGIILFGGNVSSLKQVATLTDQIEHAVVNATGIPALIAVDQEGGRVVRLSKATGMPVYVSNRKLARSRDVSAVANAGRNTGHYLRKVGINMNLAPVMDVVTSAKNKVIGDRSYGYDTALVSELGTEYIRSLQSENVIATAKHFPGHGCTLQDSHKELPIVPLEWQTLWETHVTPFYRAINANVGAIMTAHIVYKALDPDNPATMSPTILTDLLRDKLGFRGLIVSDSMTMGAITNSLDCGEAVARAVAAGVDVVLIPGDRDRQLQAYESLLNAAARDPDMAARINNSARRILDTKRRFKIWKP